jgi:hypothetical protein
VVVLRQLLCTELTVPDDVEPLPDVPSQSGEATVRERLAEHREDPSCAACHDSIDPLGLAFEHYDAVGAYRDAYTGGQPVDATGTVDALDVDITDAIDLAYALATADDVRDCYQRHAFRYAHGRRETEGDACALSGVEEAFSGGDIIELLVAIASSDSFRFRPAPEEAR